MAGLGVLYIGRSVLLHVRPAGEVNHFIMVLTLVIYVEDVKHLNNPNVVLKFGCGVMCRKVRLQVCFELRSLYFCTVEQMLKIHVAVALQHPPVLLVCRVVSVGNTEDPAPYVDFRKAGGWKLVGPVLRFQPTRDLKLTQNILLFMAGEFRPHRKLKGSW